MFFSRFEHLGAVAFVFLFVFLAACTIRADISVSEVVGISSIGSTYQQVTTLTPQTPRTRSSGSRLFAVKTRSDLERIVDSKGMAFLYYEVKDCTQTSSPEVFYSDAVYKDASGKASDGGTFVYYAAVPKDFRQAAMRSREVMGHSTPETLPELCIGLGAGSKGGLSRLQTNFVPIGL
jgi:hypothetical protein